MEVKNLRGVALNHETLTKFKENQEVLIGTLLGDASLQTYSDGKTWRLRYLQKNEEYIKHLYEIWNSFTGTPPKLATDKNGNKRWYFNTLTFNGFTDIALKFYTKSPKGSWIKKVPSDIEITPKILAYWYMDDGSKKSNCASNYLCTDSFSREDLDLLKHKLDQSCGIRVNYHRTEKKNIRLYIPKKYNETFENLIQPYILPSFKYKLHSDNSR